MKIIDAKLYRNSGKLLVPYDFCETISHPTSGRTRKNLLLPVRVWIVVDMCSDLLLCARDLGSYFGFDRDKNEVWERDYMSQEKLSYFRRYPTRTIFSVQVHCGAYINCLMLKTETEFVAATPFRRCHEIPKSNPIAPPKYVSQKSSILSCSW